MSTATERTPGYWPKFQHIVPTFLAVGALAVIGLIVFRILLDRYLPSIEIKEDLWEFWIPFALPIVPIAIWLRPRARILTFERDTENLRFLVLVIAILAIAVPSMISQHFILRALSELYEVQDMSQIDVNRAKRYYKIRDFEVVEHLGSAHSNVHASGRYSEHLDFDFFFVFPVATTGGNAHENHNYWYGIKHHRQISNRLSIPEKERHYKKAYEDGLEKIKKHDFFDQEFLEVVQASYDRDNYRKAVESQVGSSQIQKVIILVPGEGAFEDRTGGEFDWIFLSAGIGLVAFLLLLTWPTYNQAELHRQRSGKMPKGDILTGLKEFFIPRNDYFAAPILLDTIILAYLILVFSGVHPINPAGADLLDWGANRRAETTGGEWWRLVSSMFLHGGLMHLMLNMYGLFLAAFFVEPVYGRVRFFIIYFVSGICGSLASIWWYENTLSVGASGAIFGLFGAIFALALLGVMRFRDLSWLWFFVGINLLFGLTGGIDNAAHLGGLTAGVLVGAVLQLSSLKPAKTRSS